MNQYMSFRAWILVGLLFSAASAADDLSEDKQFWAKFVEDVSDSLAPAPTVSPGSITMAQAYFTVLTEPLDEFQNVSVSSETTLFIPSWTGDIDAPNDVVCFVGESYMLETNITSFLWGGDACTAENGCGVHVHEGFDCTDAETQGK